MTVRMSWQVCRHAAQNALTKQYRLCTIQHVLLSLVASGCCNMALFHANVSFSHLDSPTAQHISAASFSKHCRRA